ncbi:MAG: ankyrin repeat domain-containing protein, partial [Desulfovibrionaceae bacterium]|nr:ankyrin repeat domain-containing protein [Desulfovibrionaceae bacterium]
QVEAARLALQAGAPPDAADAQGQTALMLAAARGHAPLARLLLAAGAAPRRADPSGLTAAAHARRAGHAALAREIDSAARPGGAESE